ncbi:MAG: ATP synthase F1 subunit gamma [Candidatus Marinamargulisbacteria bacterium]|nr:ATP synthase F1 subunit gamma [Candidatus Marinamargulisbacteria bacterium]
MSTERDLRDRIASVKKTQKMTGAMKMVAAAKFKQLGNKIQAFSAYADAINQSIQTVCSDLAHHNDVAVFKPNQSPLRKVIVLGGDRGLCGSFNASVFKQALTTIETDKDTVFSVGQKSRGLFKSQRIDAHDLKWTADSDGFQLIQEQVASFLTGYQQGEFGELIVVRQAFYSAIRIEVQVETLLPISINSAAANASMSGRYDYVPSQGAVLDQLASQYLTTKLFQWVAENRAGEESSRMNAMESATTNAGDMIKDLELSYNRARQSAITTELTEIVAGAEALIDA